MTDKKTYVIPVHVFVEAASAVGAYRQLCALFPASIGWESGDEWSVDGDLLSKAEVEAALRGKRAVMPGDIVKINGAQFQVDEIVTEGVREWAYLSRAGADEWSMKLTIEEAERLWEETE